VIQLGFIYASPTGMRIQHDVADRDPQLRREFAGFRAGLNVLELAPRRSMMLSRSCRAAIAPRP
jgi:hypothetical protein